MDKVWDQMKSGAWYDAEDVSLRQLRASCKAKLQQFNAMPESDRQQAIGILYTLLDAQEGLNIEAPFRCDYGPNIHLGRNFYANFNFSVLDEADVASATMSSSAPTWASIRPSIRWIPRRAERGSSGQSRCASAMMYGSAKAAQILPGVTIGSRSVISRQRGHARYPGRCGREREIRRVIRSLKGEQDEEDRQV